MSYQTHNIAVLERFFTVVARADGSPIATGTVSYFLKGQSGANAGKWWRNSDQTWQAAETANAMTHDADGHWRIVLSGAPFANSERYLEYVRESGGLHVPDARHLVGAFEPHVDASQGMRLQAAQRVVLAASQPDYAPSKPGDAMTLTTGERLAVANTVETQIIDDTDSERVLQAIVDKIAAANPSLDDLTLGGIAAAVRSELAAELGRLDVAVSSRLAASAYSGSGGGGGGTTVQVLPLVTSVQTEPVRPSPLVAYEVAVMTHRVAVFDSQGDPIDLSGKSLQLSIETLSGGLIGFTDEVTVSGEDQNQLQVTAPAEWHSLPGLYRYAIRDVLDGDRVWTHGEYQVLPAAGPH